MTPQLAGQTETALADWARAEGARPGAARVLARALVAQFAGRDALVEPAREWSSRAAAHFDAGLPAFEATSDPDGTVRFAVTLSDGAVIETVLICQAPSETRARERWTVCLSSQVGCARGCTFCETGRLGLKRNLTAAEIVAQYAIAAGHSGAAPHNVAGSAPRNDARSAPRNVVFMGMGEPLDNLDEVLRAIEVLREPAGFAVPERRITVSTVGIIPKMDELAARSRANLAVSLHAIDRAARRSLLPIARKYPLEDLRAAIARAPRTVLLQWTLIAGVNDSDADADQLIAFAGGLDVRVNLIPLNPGPLDTALAPSLLRCRAFQKRIADAGIRALLRMPHGQSIGGACGQLAGARRVPVMP